MTGLRALGIRAGGCVMVHASLRALGAVEDGASGVLAALEETVGPEGGLLMVLGRRDEAGPFDPLVTPADPDVGRLAEVFRTRPGVRVTNNPEGRFGAWGALAPALLAEAPWDDYFGPGSPLDHLCRLGGVVLRLGADPDTTTLLHLAEYLAPVAAKRRVRRRCRVLGPDGPRVRTITCLDDSKGIVDWPGEDYFKSILDDYLGQGLGRRGRVGGARSERLDAADFVAFGAAWMGARF